MINTPIKRSSAIQNLSYDPIKRTLIVTLTGGKTYTHANVSAAEHSTLLSAPSVGKAYNQMFLKRPPEP
jgi:hypothetical protein